MRFYKKYFLILLAVLFQLSFSFAEKVTDLKATDYVNDYAGVLTLEQKDELSKTLGDLEKQKGYQVTVFTVNEMLDEFGKPDYIEHYAVKLYQQLGLGNKNNIRSSDEGVLFLISKNDRSMRIEVGYGLESLLTDGVTKNILDNYVRPEFKLENYYGGIKIGIDDIFKVLGGEKIGEVGAGYSQDDLGGFFQFFVIFFVLGLHAIAWFGAVMARTKSWWLGGLLGAGIGSIVYFSLFTSIIGVAVWIVVTIFGILFDFLISKNYKYYLENPTKGRPGFWSGGTWGPGSGGFGGRGGSGFGGFGGGGMSGGGGSSSSW